MGMKVYLNADGILIPFDHDSGNLDGGNKCAMIYVTGDVFEKKIGYTEEYRRGPVCSPNRDLKSFPQSVEMELPISPTEFFGVLVEYILDNAKEVKK